MGAGPHPGGYSHVVPRSLHEPWDLGGVRVPNRVVLAPLAGIGNWFVRLQAKRYGAGLAVSEMVSSHAIHYGNRKTLEEMLVVHPDERAGGPVAIQLFGAEPEIMRSAAAVVAERGADLIDLNMGCPVPKVMKTGAGAAMIRDPDVAVAVARAAREGSGLPVTVKLRAAVKPGGTEGAEVARRLVEDAGVAGLTFHPRSAAVRHKGTPDYELAARLVEQLGEQPRVAQGAAGEHDRGAARVLEHPAHVVAPVHAAGDDHGDREVLHQLGGEVVVRRALVAHLDVARVECDAGHAGLLGQAPGDGDALGAQLDRDGQAGPLARGARDRDRGVRVLEQRRARARLHDLGDGTAHVEVDQVGAALGDHGGGGAHHLGVLPEQLDRHRPSRPGLALGLVDAQQLGVGAPVVVVDREARDHLAHDEAGAVAAGLQSYEPVADPGQRRQHDAVGDGQAAECPGVGERARHGP